MKSGTIDDGTNEVEQTQGESTKKTDVIDGKLHTVVSWQLKEKFFIECLVGMSLIQHGRNQHKKTSLKKIQKDDEFEQIFLQSCLVDI